MSDRERDMGRLASREQGKDDTENIDSTESESTTESSESASAEDTATPSGSDTTSSAASTGPINVKDREETLFAYLPESLANDVDLACQSVNMVYQRETGEKLGRNRYLYPIILMVGADNAVDLSHDEIQDLVERIDDIEDAV